ncbi:hypothetical protein [Fulvimarina sp. MAC3]|uniref:hypothetical protein n=1 Tax=Fulvimarina sp. MAC3 TaxID=3148887 RepID=UPI0031FE370D
MRIELIGLIVVLIGVWTVYRGLNFGLAALALFSLLGASAALILPALGGASIQPAHLSLAFLSLTIAIRPALIGVSFSSLNYPNPGFWFATFVLYSVVTAVFMPRIFAGSTVTYSLARGNEHHFILATPLRPTTTNITQAVYLLGDIICFAAAFASARLGEAGALVKAILIAGVLCAAFAFLDLATYATGTQELMDVIRNANYRMLEDGEIQGFKRIVGSFSEAGAYGYAALGFYAFALMLWIENYPSRLAGPLALTLIVTILLATSTTAYAATAFLSLGVLVYCVSAIFSRRANSRHLLYVLICVVAIPVGIAIASMMPEVRDSVLGLFERTVVNKLDSQSGEERMRWNDQALISFADTAGLGGGLGSIRTSSFVVALLSNVGLPGTLIFVLFFISLARLALAETRKRTLDPVVIAGLTSCFALIAAAAISAGAVDLGIMFCLYAGLATGLAMGARTVWQLTPPAYAQAWIGSTSTALQAASPRRPRPVRMGRLSSTGGRS